MTLVLEIPLSCRMPYGHSPLGKDWGWWAAPFSSGSVRISWATGHSSWPRGWDHDRGLLWPVTARASAPAPAPARPQASAQALAQASAQAEVQAEAQAEVQAEAQSGQEL